MHILPRRGVLLSVFVIGCVLLSRPVPLPAQSSESAASPTILAKTPVFAGACKACPWGILAKVTADALSFYGYHTKICWVCWSSYGPREMGDRTKPVMPPASEINDPEYVEAPPDAIEERTAEGRLQVGQRARRRRLRAREHVGGGPRRAALRGRDEHFQLAQRQAQALRSRFDGHWSGRVDSGRRVVHNGMLTFLRAKRRIRQGLCVVRQPR